MSASENDDAGELPRGVLPRSPRVGVALIVGVALGLVGSMFAFSAVAPDDPDAALTGAEEFAVALPLLVALGGCALVASAVDGGRPLRVFGLTGLDRWSVPIGLLTGVVLQVVVALIDTFAVAPLVDDDPGEAAQDLVDAFATPSEKVLLVLLVVLLAPVAEELFYRGVLLPLALGRWRTWTSVALVGVLFALSHLQPAQLPGLVVVGCALGGLRVWRGTVAAPIAAHVAFNAVGLLAIAVGMSW